MTQFHERITMAVVTGASHKFEAVQHQFPESHVIWVRPLPHIDEKRVAPAIPFDVTRSARMAHEKAVMDVTFCNAMARSHQDADWINFHHFEGAIEGDGFVHISLHNDVVRYIPDTGQVFERAKTFDEWVAHAHAQSEKKVWITGSHTGVGHTARHEHLVMHTVGVSAKFFMRNFTEDELVVFARRVGIDRVMDCSGGLPVELATDFFDHTQDISVYYYADPLHASEAIHVTDIPWHFTNPVILRSLATGAFRMPLQHLVDQVVHAL